MESRNIIFVTSYPERGETHSATTVGVASYAKQLAEALVKHKSKLELVVLAEKLSQSDNKYIENGINVERKWIRGSVANLVSLIGWVLQSSPKRILVSFEINMFGGIIHAIVMLLGLIFLRILGRHVTLILHQVPDQNARQNGLLKWLGWWIGINIYQLLVKLASSEIVVFEKYFEQLLGSEKSIFIPHALPIVKTSSIKNARKKLGWDEKEEYALVFGYIAPYKGQLRLVKNWNEKSSRRLIVAGGINPNHMERKQILTYVEKVKHLARRKNIEVTGFVDEQLMNDYFAAADVVLIPYEMLFSSSGPLAWAIACKKPIVFSRELKLYFESEDFQLGIIESRLDINQIITNFDKDYAQSIDYALKNREKWGKFGEVVNSKRSWGVVAERYLEVIGEI